MKREREIERKKRRWESELEAIDWGSQQLRKIETTSTFFPDLVEKVENLSTEGISRTSSNRRDKKNKYSGSLELFVRTRRERRRNEEEPLYD